MAITRAQQVRQMLEDGGMLVSPSTTGKRPGYRSARAQEVQGRTPKTSTFDSQREDDTPKDREDTPARLGEFPPGYNPRTGRFEKPDGTPEVARTPEEVQQSLDAAIAQGKFKKKNPIEKFFDNYTKGTRKTLYNIFPNNPKNELDYLRSLPFSQRALLSPALKAKLEALELDEDQDLLDTANTKFTFDEFEELRKFQPTDGSLNFAEYAAKFKGAPGLLYSGNVGNLEKYVTGKDEFGRTMYGYREKPDDGPNLIPTKNIPDPTDQTDPADPNQTTDVFTGIAPRFAGSIFDFDKLRRQLEEQSAAEGGRIGANEGGIMKASYGYDDAMGEAFEEFLRLKKIKEIPADMEFDEYLDQLDIDVPYSKKDKGEQRIMAQEGGIMDLETGRQMYFLGKLVKKATRAVKKIAKSPIGKAALLGGALYFGGGGAGGFSGLLKKGLLKKGATEFTLANLSPMKAIGLASLGSLFLTPKEEEDDPYRGPDIDIANIRANPYNFLTPRFTGTTFAAEGGRMGYQEGSKEPVATKTMPLLDMDGKEMDLRDNGGFVPIGRMEKADDVPARLSKNEFVFTADAVRNAGDGDVDKGAEVMYNMMKNLEAGGEVSEESQGLEGARKMFQTSKRLEEVL
jgi:hypothetical protein